MMKKNKKNKEEIMTKTIKELSEMDGRVYVHLASAEKAERFLRQAEEEGFTFADGVKPTERHCSEIMAVNHDRTINYVGYVGHMAYGSGTDEVNGEKLIRVEYE